MSSQIITFGLRDATQVNNANNDGLNLSFIFDNKSNLTILKTAFVVIISLVLSCAIIPRRNIKSHYKTDGNYPKSNYIRKYLWVIQSVAFFLILKCHKKCTKSVIVHLSLRSIKQFIQNYNFCKINVFVA